MKNPFPGPQPYRAADRDKFFGRSDMARKLEGQILANRCVTVYGPSGAGKSSILQASVFPTLVDRYDVRFARVDAWPAGEKPLEWVASALHATLGFEELANGANAHEALLRSIRAAARSSPRLFVIYLDQLEQLLFAERTVEETQPFFDCVEELLDIPLRNVRVVLSLREDYLGRFRDRLRDLRRIMENGFRVGPLEVGELTESVVLAAAAGDPPQAWSTPEMRELMMQVRLPGQAATEQAEAQSAYAQIICRALFQQRAAGKTIDATEAEPILRNYLASTLAELGPLEKRAQQLLEDHLVSSDGSRTLRTEKELAKVLEPADLTVVLKQLESAAILRAEAHHGSRYFEIGHDWLARKVYEQRAERERLAEQKRIEAEQAKQLAAAREQQKKLRRIAAGAVAIAALVAAAAVVALIARSEAIVARNDARAARDEAKASEQKALWQRDEANDLRVMAGYLALQSQGNSGGAMKLLTEVKKPEERGGWVEYANLALKRNSLFVTLTGHRAALRSAVFSADGKFVLTASDDHTARVWKADGTGPTIVLAGHQGAITAAEFSPDSKGETLRVLTTSADGTARIWTIRGGQATSIELPGKTTRVTAGAWSPDGKQVAVALVLVEPAAPPRPEKQNVYVRVHGASDGALVGEMPDHRDIVNSVVFLDDTHVISASDDKTVRVWDGVTKGKISQAPGHVAPVSFVAVQRKQGLVVTASADSKARVFKVGVNSALTPFATLDGHTREVLHAAISDDGKFVATGSADHTARVWKLEQPVLKGKETILDEHTGPVNYVAFRPGNSDVLATASGDHSARLYHVSEPEDPFVLSGHAAQVKSIEWDPTGERLVTAAYDSNQSASADHSAKIFDTKTFEGAAPWPITKHFQMAGLGATGEAFVAALDDGTIQAFDKRGSKTPALIKAPATEAWGLVSAVATTSDGGRIAIATAGKDVLGETAPASTAKSMRGLHIFDKGNWEQAAKQYEVDSTIRHIEWDHAAKSVIAALENGTAMVFRPGDNGAPVVLKGHSKWVTSASFSRDDKRILTTSIDGTVLVFDAQGNGSSTHRFEHPGVVYAAVFDASGQRIATACADGKVRVFELAQPKAIAELDAKSGVLHRLAWSDDGTSLAAASLSGTIVVWSHLSWPLAGEHRPALLQTETPAVALGFLEKSATVIAAAGDSVHAWKLDAAQLKVDLQSRNRDCLGIDERVLYLNETRDVATQGFAACEKAQGRSGSGDAAQPTDATQSIVARLVVWPSSAEVEMDGIAIHRRDVFVELWGKQGEKRKVRVIDGNWSNEVDVTLDASGAKPAVIDLEATRPKGDGQREKKLGEGLDVFINQDPVF